MRFTKGLNRDVDPSAQPEGTYRDLINGIVTDDSGTIQIEDGTEVVEALSGSIVGDIILSDDTLVLFISNGSTDEIRLFDGTSTTLIASDDFQFGNVVGTHTVDSRGDTIIYWTDGVNPPRFLNIDNPTYNTLDELNLFPEYNTSEIEFTLDNIISSGGSLNAGTYYITFSYIDEDNTLTDYFLVTKPIQILNSFGYGANDDVETSKSISFTLNNLDTDYEKIRVSSIRETNVENVIDITIPSSGSISYTYTGNEDSTAGSLDEVVINNPIYETANALEQHDNSLYLGGLTGKELSRSEKELLQDAALNSTINAVFKNESNTRFYQDSKNAFQNKSFKRGEAYAFYVSFIKSDGRETDAFHIPGREAINGTENSKSTITVNNIEVPPDQAAEATFTELTNIPQNGEKATAGWEVNSAAGDIPGSAQTINIRFEDGGGNNEFIGLTTYQYEITTSNDWETQLKDIRDELNNNYMPADWEVVYSSAVGFEFQSTSDGSQYNGFEVLLSIGTDESWSWTSLQESNSVTSSDGYVGDTTADGENNGVFTEDISITFSPDGVSNFSTTINADTDTLFWGSESEIVGGDSRTSLANKLTEMFNDPQNASSSSHTSFFTDLQSNYTFTHNSGDIEGLALSDGGDLNGFWTISNANIVQGGTDTVSFRGGYLQGDGIDININPQDITNLSGASAVVKTYTQGDNINTFLSTFVSDLQTEIDDEGVTDLTVSVDGNSIIFEETDQSETYVGSEPDIYEQLPINVTGGTFNFSVQSFTNVVNFDEQGTTTSTEAVEGVKEYQLYAQRDPNTDLGFWENQNEQYPSVSPFTDNNLDGENVRHHRFPDNVWGDPAYDPQTDTINITGIQLKNLSIDNSLTDEIVGYKVYYAKKNEGNQLCLGQGSFNQGWVDRQSTTSDENLIGYRGARPHQQNDAIFNEDILVTHGFDELAEWDVGSGYQSAVEWGSNGNFGYGRPVDIILNNVNVSGATFVKKSYEAEYDHQEINDLNIDGELNPVDNYTQGIEAKTRIDANQRNINLTSIGFSYDMDNLFGESKVVLELPANITPRGTRVCSDVCQDLTDVHLPFTNQILVDTGYIGQLDSNGDQISPDDEIYGGDIYIGENYYRANTLLALSELDYWAGGTDSTDTDNEWWTRRHGRSDTSNVPETGGDFGLNGESPFGNYWLSSEAVNYMFDDLINYGDAQGIDQAIREVIGSSGNIISFPFAYSNLYKEVVESRINTSILYSGTPERESVYPQETNWTDRPYPPSSPVDLNNVERRTTPYQFTKWWHEQFNNWDNYYNWNQLYEKQQDVKTSFPWNPSEFIDINNQNRVIRSASNSENGRSESFRQFRENDFLDLPRNRGDITNLENVENNLLVHMDRALIYTRGREELRTQDFEVFLGNGDIFAVKPNEVLITDAGYAGLQDPLASVNCKYGYFFVDQQDNKILWMSQQGIKDLTTKQFGLHNFFREDFDSTNALVGYDSNRERVIISTDSHTLVFNPDLGIWSTFLSYTPDYMLRTLSTFFTQNSLDLYRHKEGLKDIYDNNITFNITYSKPTGFNSKLNHVWFNADNIDSSGSITEDIPFNTIRVQNSHQDTGNISLTEYSTNPDDITNRGNTRKSQGIWRINNIRETINNPNLPSWAQDKRLEDDYHLVTLEFTNTNDELLILKASNIQTNPTIK